MIEYEHRSDGPLVRRKVTCELGAIDCEDADRVYVYDGLNLLEEYEMEGGRKLLARYYYADDGDIPFAADFRDGAQLVRHYLVTDRVGSVTGILDASGNWVERVTYDTRGRPKIEPVEHQAPALSEVAMAANDDIMVAFSEAVRPILAPTSGTAIVDTVGSFDSAFTLTVADTSASFTASLEPTAYVSHARGATVRLTPTAPIADGTAVELHLVATHFHDTWSNVNAAATVTFNATTGCVYGGATPGSTVIPATERSAVGNAVLFQAHLYDYDADIYLMRARAFDPNTGAFLQRDPSKYRDSVNLYAGLKHDGVNNRDPSGECVWESDGDKQEQCWNRASDYLARASTSESDPRRCEEVVRAIVENRLGRLRPEDYDCVYAVYSAKDGVTITDDDQKRRGVNLDHDELHRRMVRLFARAELRAVRWPYGFYYGQQRAFAEAIRLNGDNRRRLRLTESLLGRDVNRYFYGRLTPWFRQINEIYEKKKKKDIRGSQLTDDPGSALGGAYFLEQGIAHGLKCGYARVVPLFEASDAQREPSSDPEADDYSTTILCGDEDTYWIRDFPPDDTEAGIEKSF